MKRFVDNTQQNHYFTDDNTKNNCDKYIFFIYMIKN